ncbi:hypothetical protein BD413DRAFT_180190 [Trametes elegans]|nr:hypothetical protein BD413DRAFT_180190 [Trametes elegans]
MAYARLLVQHHWHRASRVFLSMDVEAVRNTLSSHHAGVRVQGGGREAQGMLRTRGNLAKAGKVVLERVYEHAHTRLDVGAITCRISTTLRVPNVCSSSTAAFESPPASFCILLCASTLHSSSLQPLWRASLPHRPAPPLQLAPGCKCDNWCDAFLLGLRLTDWQNRA